VGRGGGGASRFDLVHHHAIFGTKSRQCCPPGTIAEVLQPAHLPLPVVAAGLVGVAKIDRKLDSINRSIPARENHDVNHRILVYVGRHLAGFR